jgi:gluconolactonase
MVMAMGLAGCDDDGAMEATPADGAVDAASIDGASGPGDAGAVPWRCPAGPFGSPLAGAAVLVPVQVNGVPPDDGVLPGWSILEGPVWADGGLYLSQWSGGRSRILRVDATEAISVLVPDAGVNGLALDGNGDLVGACHVNGSVSRFPLSAPHQRVVIADRFQGAPFRGPNDLAVRRDGTIYFSDLDSQRLFRIAPGGEVSLIDDSLKQPNGVTLSVDEQTLYVAEYSAGADRQVHRYQLAADGTAGGKALFNAGGGDGMVVDCAGNLYVARGKAVVVVDRQGTTVGSIPVDVSEGVTNLAFGGPDRRTLYITSFGNPPRLHRVSLGVPGLPY